MGWFWLFYIATVSLLQQTFYDYSHNELYVRLVNNDLFSIKFDQQFGNSTDVATKLQSPRSHSTLTLAGDNKLYAFYRDSDGSIGVDLFNGTSWSAMDITNSFDFYNASSYLSTYDNVDKIYIYGGVSSTNTSDVTDRLIELNLVSGEFSDDIALTVSPTSFYGASNILINFNTQLLVGGKAANGWVGLKQLAIWQYESWSFKSISNSDNINSRQNSQVLPIFNRQDSHDIVQQQQNGNGTSTVNIDGIMVIGGELIDDLSKPHVLKLNVTGGDWSWTSLDDQLNLDMDSLMGSCVIYQTLVTFEADGDGYNINLYNVTNSVGRIDTVDYTVVAAPVHHNNSNNKNVVIVVSVVVPIMVILLILSGWFFFNKYKNSRDPSNNYESFDIMDFYNNHSKKNSLTFGHDEVKVNNYEDNDNLSISSWRRKREEFEKSAHQKKKPIRELPPLPVMEMSQEVPERQPSYIKRSLSNFSKNFSLKLKQPSTISRISEESSGYDNDKSRSTLQLIDEEYKHKFNDSKSILSASTYYDDKVDFFGKNSPLLDNNRFSDVTMLNNESKVILDDEWDGDVDMDVQVLVSSKRRSKLRVMNPDVSEDEVEETSKDLDENVQFMDDLFEVIDTDAISVGDGARKRVVSGEKEL